MRDRLEKLRNALETGDATYPFVRRRVGRKRSTAGRSRQRGLGSIGLKAARQVTFRRSCCLPGPNCSSLGVLKRYREDIVRNKQNVNTVEQQTKEFEARLRKQLMGEKLEKLGDAFDTGTITRIHVSSAPWPLAPHRPPLASPATENRYQDDVPAG
jgi:hypothetical protein